MSKEAKFSNDRIKDMLGYNWEATRRHFFFFIGELTWKGPHSSMNRWQPCCSGDATDTCLGGRHFGSSQAWVVHDRLGGLDVHAAYLLDVGYNRIHDDRPPPMNSGNSLVTSKANSGLL